MTPRLIQNTNIYNEAKVINNNLGNVLCQKRWHSCNHLHNTLHVIAKYNKVCTHVRIRRYAICQGCCLHQHHRPSSFVFKAHKRCWHPRRCLSTPHTILMQAHDFVLWTLKTSCNCIFLKFQGNYIYIFKMKGNADLDKATVNTL